MTIGRFLAKLLLLISALFSQAAAAKPIVGGIERQPPTPIVTHHYDISRTGWNSTESGLTPYSLTPGVNAFGQIARVTLDDAIYAQPLVAPNQVINCPVNQPNAAKGAVVAVTCQSGIYEVVYVATNANTLYAINAANGDILLSRNFGPKADCGGIVATPVIDFATRTLYVVAHTTSGGDQPHTLYAVNLATLQDAKPPFVVSGFNTHQTLSDGTVYSFNVSATCLRSALLLLNGKIYAGFRGNEYILNDTIQSGPTRGWVLGWNAADLTAIAPMLTDTQATSTNSFFLASIWMSGSGLASDGSSIYFSTGNSDPSGGSYDPVKNIEESIVKVTPDLKLASVFTPSDYATLDQNDMDLGSGGVLAIPNAPLIVSGGKDGRLFLMNSGNLGGYTAGGPDKVLDTKSMGACWCAPSYFMGPDGAPRIVTSGGGDVITWKLTQGPSGLPQLTQDGTASIVTNTEDGGFFTAVSSDNSGPNYKGIIWAASRPTAEAPDVTLYAFDATPVAGTHRLIGQYPVGSWTQPTNANIVPVVANGKIHIASGGPSQGLLTILGFNPKAQTIPDIIVTSVSYSSETQLFTSVVKNIGAAATPLPIAINVAYYVDDQYATWGSFTGVLGAGQAVTIGTQSGPYTLGAGTHKFKAMILR